MKKICLYLLLLSFLTGNHTISGQELPWTTPEKVGLSQKGITRLEKALNAHIKNHELAGGVALIARKGRTAYLQSFGYMDIESKKPMRNDAIFRIASMTKLMTSVAVMILFEEDYFSLDDPVSLFIPDFKKFKVAVPPKEGEPRDHPLETVPLDREITIRDLLRHTSGISCGFGFNHVDHLYRDAAPYLRTGSFSEFIGRLIQLPLAYQPGTCWEYSLSTDVLGYLIEILSSQKLDQFLEERLFKQLELHDTDFFVPGKKLERFPNLYEFTGKELKLMEKATKSRFTKRPLFLSGGGGLVSTVSDYARFLQMLLNGGQLDGRRILSRKTIELMLSDHLIDISPNWLDPGTGFGLGAAVVTNISQNGNLGSNGLIFWAGIYNTFFFMDPHEKMIGILMTQMAPFELLNLSSRFRKLCMQTIID